MLDLQFELLDRSNRIRGTVRLLRLLTALDAAYVPPISSMTDLPAYCDKLVTHAEVLIVTHDGNDIGYIAFYANDEAQRYAFLSAVAVKPDYHGRGIGASLLCQAMARAKDKGMERMRLEVRQLNHAAVSLYRKFEFNEVDRSAESERSGWLIMERVI